MSPKNLETVAFSVPDNLVARMFSFLREGLFLKYKSEIDSETIAETAAEEQPAADNSNDNIPESKGEDVTAEGTEEEAPKE